MKFCNNCGASVGDNDKHCGKCGAKLFDHNIEPYAGTSVNRSKRKYPFILISILAFLFIAISATFLYKPAMYKYYTSKASKEITTDAKLQNYFKSLEYNYDVTTITTIKSLLNDLNDADAEQYLSYLKNILDNNSYSNIYLNIYSNKIAKALKDEDYKLALSYIESADKKGFGKSNFKDYDTIIAKLEEEKKAQEAAKEAKESKANTESKEEVVYNISYYTYDGSNYNPITYSDYIIPYSNYRYLTLDDVAGFDKVTLSLARNEIFARHGYIFKQQPFKTYFPNKSWYVSDPYYDGSYSALNDYEIYNVEFIKSLEQ